MIMNNIKVEKYFTEKYQKLNNLMDIMNLDQEYDYDFNFLAERILNLYSDDFYENLDYIMNINVNINVPKFSNVCLVKEKDKLIKSNLPMSCFEIVHNSLAMFYFKSYYNSLISIPVFDHIFNSLASNYLFLANTVFDTTNNGNIEEISKSTPTILKIIGENSKYKIDNIFELLFTDKHMHSDIRSLYSHYNFKNKEHIKALSHIYNLMLINYFLFNKNKAIIYVK